MYEDAVMGLYPTAAAAGTVIQKAIKSGTAVYKTTEISPLNGIDYDIKFDGFDDSAPKITYTLKDTTLGVFELVYDLPAIGDTGYIWNVETAPTNNAQGEISATHTTYPGLEAFYTLPALNDTEYDIYYTNPQGGISGTVTYTYKQTNSPAVSFETVLIDIESLDVSYNNISFSAEENYQYAVVLKGSEVDGDTVWKGGETIGFDVNPDLEYTIYARAVYNNIPAQ